MSETVIFQIGAVVFVAVTATVFLYGMSVFREWQDRDDTRAAIGDPVDKSAEVNLTVTKNENSEQVVPIDQAPTPGGVSRRSAA